MLNCKEDGCYICGKFPVEEHHIMFGTANRKLATKYKVTCYLCYEHHQGDTGAHFNRELDLRLKQEGQKELDERMGEGTFFKVFGRNYL